MSSARYNQFILLVAGLGGLLYGVDVGIIAGALPYLEATAGLNAGQLSMVVAAVLLGSVISTLFAGLLADWIGRKPLMSISGLVFVMSIPVICLSHGYVPLVLGRLLQGFSAGLIGVVVPLYLAECLGASNRGKGTGIFQWILTLGIAGAALAGMLFSIRVNQVARLGNAAAIFAFKDRAWRDIFWVSLAPGLLFTLGSLFVGESPRWLFWRGHRSAALRALLRSRTTEEAERELREMEDSSVEHHAGSSFRTGKREPLLLRKYIAPFLLACTIVACNQATGINSIIGYNTTILVAGGLSDLSAHWSYVGFTVVLSAMTLVGIALVDRKGRKFLLSWGTGGILVSLACIGTLFNRVGSRRVDVRDAVQTMVASDQALELEYDDNLARRLIPAGRKFENETSRQPTCLTVIYSYGGFHAASQPLRSEGSSAITLRITRGTVVPANRVLALFSNPFANLIEARKAGLKIDHAWITPVPDARTGWLLSLCLLAFAAFYSCGPGVCVWLAMSELMPTRIRSNGMGIALLLNQSISTVIAAVFLPAVGRFSYAVIFWGFAVCTAIYFFVARFLLLETKGKTLEEIQQYFESRPRIQKPAAKN